MQSAAAAAAGAPCVAILLLLLLLLLVAVCHRTPVTGLFFIQTAVVVLTVNLFYCKRKYSSTPLSSTFVFVRPRLLPIPHLSRPFRVFAEPQVGVSPLPRSPACNKYL